MSIILAVVNFCFNMARLVFQKRPKRASLFDLEINSGCRLYWIPAYAGLTGMLSIGSRGAFCFHGVSLVFVELSTRSGGYVHE
jgi:hypothetical protein